MSDNNYDWPRGVFNPACVCGGSINRPNPDCERCAFHGWVYQQADDIRRLRSVLRNIIDQDEVAEARAIASTALHGFTGDASDE